MYAPNIPRRNENAGTRKSIARDRKNCGIAKTGAPRSEVNAAYKKRGNSGRSRNALSWLKIVVRNKGDKKRWKPSAKHVLMHSRQQGDARRTVGGRNRREKKSAERRKN